MNTRSAQIPTKDLKRPSELADSTSDFRLKDLRALKIQYNNVGNPFENSPTLRYTPTPGVGVPSAYPVSLLIKNKNKEQLLDMQQNENMANDLNDEERTLAEHVSNVLIKEFAKAGKRERITDAFVNYLLGVLRF